VSKLRCVGILLSISSVVQVIGCSSEQCTAAITCMRGVTLQFEPTIAFRREVVATVSGDGVRYSATATPTHDTADSLWLLGKLVSDAGTCTVQLAQLDGKTPTFIEYNITADGVTVAEGNATPQYRTVTKGEGSCAESCSQAQVTIAVSQ
jgi:hypothetical protein